MGGRRGRGWVSWVWVGLEEGLVVWEEGALVGLDYDVHDDDEFSMGRRFEWGLALFRFSFSPISREGKGRGVFALIILCDLDTLIVLWF